MKQTLLNLLNQKDYTVIVKDSSIKWSNNLYSVYVCYNKNSFDMTIKTTPQDSSSLSTNIVFEEISFNLNAFRRELSSYSNCIQLYTPTNFYNSNLNHCYKDLIELIGSYLIELYLTSNLF